MKEPVDKRTAELAVYKKILKVHSSHEKTRQIHLFHAPFLTRLGIFTLPKRLNHPNFGGDKNSNYHIFSHL
jgi:hypothetical protein